MSLEERREARRRRRQEEAAEGGGDEAAEETTSRRNRRRQQAEDEEPAEEESSARSRRRRQQQQEEEEAPAPTEEEAEEAAAREAAEAAEAERRRQEQEAEAERRREQEEARRKAEEERRAREEEERKEREAAEKKRRVFQSNHISIDTDPGESHLRLGAKSFDQADEVHIDSKVWQQKRSENFPGEKTNALVQKWLRTESDNAPPVAEVPSRRRRSRPATQTETAEEVIQPRSRRWNRPESENAQTEVITPRPRRSRSSHEHDNNDFRSQALAHFRQQRYGDRQMPDMPSQREPSPEPEEVPDSLPPDPEMEERERRRAERLKKWRGQDADKEEEEEKQKFVESRRREEERIQEEARRYAAEKVKATKEKFEREAESILSSRPKGLPVKLDNLNANQSNFNKFRLAAENRTDANSLQVKADKPSIGKLNLNRLNVYENNEASLEADMKQNSDQAGRLGDGVVFNVSLSQRGRTVQQTRTESQNSHQIDDGEELEHQRLQEEYVLEQRRWEEERLEQERLEEEGRLEQERLEAEERLEQERLEEEERIEQERLEEERLEQERLEEEERLEQEKRFIQETLEEERLERERLEQEERLERERLEAEGLNRERDELEQGSGKGSLSAIEDQRNAGSVNRREAARRRRGSGSSSGRSRGSSQDGEIAHSRKQVGGVTSRVEDRKAKFESQKVQGDKPTVKPERRIYGAPNLKSLQQKFNKHEEETPVSKSLTGKSATRERQINGSSYDENSNKVSRWKGSSSSLQQNFEPQGTAVSVKSTTRKTKTSEEPSFVSTKISTLSAAASPKGDKPKQWVASSGTTKQKKAMFESGQKHSGITRHKPLELRVNSTNTVMKKWKTREESSGQGVAPSTHQSWSSAPAGQDGDNHVHERRLSSSSSISSTSSSTWREREAARHKEEEEREEQERLERERKKEETEGIELALEELYDELEELKQRRREILSQRIQPLPQDLDSLTNAELNKLVKELHQKVANLEEEVYDWEVKIRKQDYEINELTLKVNDMKGKFVKPVLRKVSKTEAKLAKIEKKEAKDFRTNLKSTGHNKYALEEEKESGGPAWRENLKTEGEAQAEES